MEWLVCFDVPLMKHFGSFHPGVMIPLAGSSTVYIKNASLLPLVNYFSYVPFLELVKFPNLWKGVISLSFLNRAWFCIGRAKSLQCALPLKNVSSSSCHHLTFFCGESTSNKLC